VAKVLKLGIDLKLTNFTTPTKALMTGERKPEMFNAECANYTTERKIVCISFFRHCYYQGSG
jgi:hypothetical protein